MLLPNDEGFYTCQQDDCDFKSVNIFDFFDHVGTEFSWDVKVASRYSFDLFKFLESLSYMLDHGDLDTAFEAVQDTACLFVNSCSEELEGFLEETMIIGEAYEGIKSLERMLKKNGK